MHIEEILEDRQNSFLVMTEGGFQEVVIGAPHHAPLGLETLPSEEHSTSDENAGMLAYYLGRLLDCPSVIACNYFIDANKHMESDYCRKILTLKPRMLVEIHGHGGRVRADIEISSGSAAENFRSEEMARRLKEAFSGIPALQGYSVSGDFNFIRLKATRTFTVTTDKWTAFHIELPRSIRESESKYVPFCQALARTIGELLAEEDEIKKEGR